MLLAWAYFRRHSVLRIADEDMTVTSGVGSSPQNLRPAECKRLTVSGLKNWNDGNMVEIEGMENHGWRRVDSRGKQSAEDPKINLSARVARREYDDGRTRKRQ